MCSRGMTLLIPARRIVLITPRRSVGGSLKGLKVGYLPSLGAEAGATAGGAGGCRECRQTLGDLGATVEEITLPPLLEFAAAAT